MSVSGRSAIELRIEGRVQGVGFRYSTLERAEVLGLRGIVRNETDGSVFVHAEGDPERLSEFVAWCEKGPRSAHVQRVTKTTAEPQALEKFQIAI